MHYFYETVRQKGKKRDEHGGVFHLNIYKSSLHLQILNNFGT